MKSNTIIIAVVAFALGFLVHGVTRQFVQLAPGVARHWKLVNEYNAYMRNPKNYSPSPYGLGVADPFDVKPSLAALVAAGELEFIDIVLPLVPVNRVTNLHWMRFVEEHQETIVYASGNPGYADFKPSGTSPLHLQVWFKKRAKSDIQQLIEQLESIAAEKDKQ